jgi:hypothetical protein
MHLFRFLLGARSDRIKHGVGTTPTRTSARISYTVRHPLATAGFESCLIPPSADFEGDSRYCDYAWPTQHRPCRYQTSFQIP